ncbi:MAG: WD40 repeat domain-containing protein [Planctomycetota bacterium]
MSIGCRRSNALLVATLTVLLSGCGLNVPSNLDSAGDPLPPHAVIRLGTLHFLPEPNRTDVIQYSSDGKYLVTAGFTGTGALHSRVHVWERQTGRDVTPTDLKKVEATGISWMPIGHRFVTSHAAGNRWAGLRMWTIGRDRPVSLTRSDPGYLTVICAPAGEHIAARTEKEEIVLFDSNGKEEFRFPFSGKQRSFNVARVMDFSPDCQRLAVVSDVGIDIYDLTRQARTSTIATTSKSINCVRYLPDGTSVAIATDRGSRIVPVESGDAHEKVFGNEFVENVAVSSDGRWLVNAAYVGPGTIWDLNTGKSTCDLHPGETNGGIAFALDNSELAISTRRISFLEIGTWKDRPTGDGHDARIANGILADNAIWTGEYGPVIRKWDLRDGAPLDSINRMSATTSAITFTSESELAVAGLIAEIDILDIQTKKLVSSLEGSEPYTSALTYSPQQHRLISAGPDGVVHGWDYDRESRTFSSIFEQSIGIKPARPQLAVSPDGQFCACGNAHGGYVYLLRTVDGSYCWEAGMATSRSLYSPVSFTSDSKQVETMKSGYDYTTNEVIQSVQFRDCSTGKIKSQLECKAMEITAIAISQDTQFAAVAVLQNDYVNQIQIWSIPQNRLIKNLTGHFECAHWLSFTSDAKRLISLSPDTGLVWSLEQVVK